MCGGIDPHILNLTLDGVIRSDYRISCFIHLMRRWVGLIVVCVFEEEKHCAPVSGIQLQLLLEINSMKQTTV